MIHLLDVPLYLTYVVLAVGLVLFVRRLLAERTLVAAGKKAVFITGCDTGIGFHAAIQLAKTGFVVFAGCLSEESQKKLSESHPSITPIHLNVKNQKDFDAAYSIVLEAFPDGLWAVVNNAGIMQRSFMDWTTVEDYQSQIDINFLGAVRCIKTFMPLLKKIRGSRIINMTSSSTFFPFNQLSGYIASKAALDVFTRNLSIELALWDIKTVQISPGAVSTAMITTLSSKNPSDELLTKQYGKNFADEFRVDHMHLANLTPSFQGPDTVARLIAHVAASSLPWSRYIVGVDAWLFSLPLSYLPNFVGDFVARMLLRVIFSNIPHPSENGNL